MNSKAHPLGTAFYFISLPRALPTAGSATVKASVMRAWSGSSGPGHMRGPSTQVLVSRTDHQRVRRPLLPLLGPGGGAKGSGLVAGASAGMPAPHLAELGSRSRVCLCSQHPISADPGGSKRGLLLPLSRGTSQRLAPTELLCSSFKQQRHKPHRTVYEKTRSLAQATFLHHLVSYKQSLGLSANLGTAVSSWC